MAEDKGKSVGGNSVAYLVGNGRYIIKRFDRNDPE